MSLRYRDRTRAVRIRYLYPLLTNLLLPNGIRMFVIGIVVFVTYGIVTQLYVSFCMLGSSPVDEGQQLESDAEATGQLIEIEAGTNTVTKGGSADRPPSRPRSRQDIQDAKVEALAKEDHGRTEALEAEPKLVKAGAVPDDPLIEADSAGQVLGTRLDIEVGAGAPSTEVVDTDTTDMVEIEAEDEADDHEVGVERNPTGSLSPTVIPTTFDHFHNIIQP